MHDAFSSEEFSLNCGVGFKLYINETEFIWLKTKFKRINVRTDILNNNWK